MTLQTRLADFVTAVGTDIKQLRSWTGTVANLTTTDKTLVGAINEVNAKPTGGTYGTGTETAQGVFEVGTTAEHTTGTSDVVVTTPLKLQQKLTAWAQPKSTNLTTLAGVTSGTFGRTLLAVADRAAALTALALTKADVGLSAVPNVDATLRSNHSGNQPASTITGLAAVATSGSASDITTGTLPSSVLPPLAINDTFEAASQTAMLALDAQRGDVAIRTDIGRSFILAAEGASTLANWKQLTAGGDVMSVAGRTGAVVLTKTDVGLANVDNTTDAAKPVSTAQGTAINARLEKAQNLSDLASVATARTNLSVYSKTELGDPEADLVAAYTIAKA